MQALAPQILLRRLTLCPKVTELKDMDMGLLEKFGSI